MPSPLVQKAGESVWVEGCIFRYPWQPKWPLMDLRGLLIYLNSCLALLWTWHLLPAQNTAAHPWGQAVELLMPLHADLAPSLSERIQPWPQGLARRSQAGFQLYSPLLHSAQFIQLCRGPHGFKLLRLVQLYPGPLCHAQYSLKITSFIEGSRT